MARIKFYNKETNNWEYADMANSINTDPGSEPIKPLTFTGAVEATYDGSEAVEVVIPQGGGGSYYEEHTLTEPVSEYTIPLDTAKYKKYNICVHQPSSPVSLKVDFVVNGRSGSVEEKGTSDITAMFFELVETIININNSKYFLTGYSRRTNNTTVNNIMGVRIMYVTSKENCICIKGDSIPADTLITVRCWE